MLASFARFKPLIEPLTPNKLAAAQSKVVQSREALDTPPQDIADVRLGASQDVCHFSDGQDLGFAGCLLHNRPQKKGSNQEWQSATDPDARIAKMMDGSTHMAHKAEHAVDMESGAVIAVTLQAADQGDTTTIHETLAEAGEAVAGLIEREAEQAPEAKPQVHLNGITEIVADKGYHSGKVMVALEQTEVRSYIPEPKRGRRRWEGKAEEQQAVYANRRRLQGHHGKQLLKKRGELIEPSFAHCCETGGMRRTHLRGRKNILKRQLIHVCAFNLSLIFRLLLGAGTPRELRNRQAVLISAYIWLQVELKEL